MLNLEKTPSFFDFQGMNTGFRDFFRGLFEVTTNELKGYFVLFLVVFFSLIVPLVVKTTMVNSPVPEEKDLVKLDSLVKILDDRPVTTGAQYMIDPNTTSYDSLTLAGIRKDIARRIVKYRRRGGRFRYREETMKIYGLDKEMYDNLKSRLALPDSLTYVNQLRHRHMDINKAEVSDLMLLAGLDGKLAGRVKKYGNLLGGYVSADQFDEIYGLPDDNLKLLKRYFYIAKNFVPVKIEINHEGWQELAKHPYISERLAKDIIKYRQLNGRIADMNELSAFRMVDAQRRVKLLPYIEF